MAGTASWESVSFFHLNWQLALGIGRIGCAYTEVSKRYLRAISVQRIGLLIR
jgi:hypothetical protein